MAAMAQTAVQDIENRQAGDRGRLAAPLGDTTIQFTSQRPPSNAGEIRFQLNGMEIEGATAIDLAKLASTFEEDIGTEITLTRVYDIAGRIQAIYRDADYIFTRVVVPAQEIDGGFVRLEVIEAVIAAVSIEQPGKPVGPVLALAERMAGTLQGVVNPTGAALERALLNINDIPGIVRATAVPQISGTGERGSLDLFINVERDAIEGVIYADNRQTPGIGRGLFGVVATLNSYSESGDTTTFSVFNSFGYRGTSVGSPDPGGAFLDIDERNTVQIEHQRNVGIDGLVVRGRALFSRTEPGNDLAQIGLDGEQISFGIEAEYPILRTRRFELGAIVGAELFESDIDVSNGAAPLTDDQIRIAHVTLNGLLRDELGYTRVDVSLRQGLDVFGATASDSQNRSRADGQSEFTLIKASLDRLLVINEDLSFFGRVGGQYSFDSLLASEEFAVGGGTFGRAFDPSEFTGDHGFGISGELRYTQPVSIQGYAFTAEGYGFADAGLIWNKGVGMPSSETLISFGGGVRLFLPEDYFLGLELAFPANMALTRNQRQAARAFVNFSKHF